MVVISRRRLVIFDFIHRFQRIYVHNFPFPTTSLPPCGMNSTHTKTHKPRQISEQFPFLLRAWRRLCGPGECYDTIVTFRRFFGNLHFNLQNNAHGTSIRNVSFLFLSFFNVYTELINDYYTSNLDL